MHNPSTAPATERGPAPSLASDRLTGGHVCRRYLVNRDLSEQPGRYQSGSPLGGGDGKLNHSQVSLRGNDGVV